MARLGLDDVPAGVRAAVEAGLGARIVGWVEPAGGYGPSLAAIVDLAGGRRAFVKAVSPAPNPGTPELLRHELVVGRGLPATVAAPRLLVAHDDGTWVAGAWEAIAGRPPGVADLALVLDAVRGLAVDPCPVGDLPRLADVAPCDWADLAATPDHGLDDWSVRNADRLAEIEAGWADAVAGSALVHNDVRLDNLLVDRNGRVWALDWAHTVVGAPWIDLVSLGPALALQGGPEPEALLARIGPLPGDPDPDAVTTYVVALAGYFTSRGRLPDPPGLPTLRAFQRAQGEVARRWAAARLRLR